MTKKQRILKEDISRTDHKRDSGRMISRQQDGYERIAEGDVSQMDFQGPDYSLVDQFSFMTGKNIF